MPALADMAEAVAEQPGGIVVMPSAGRTTRGRPSSAHGCVEARRRRTAAIAAITVWAAAACSGGADRDALQDAIDAGLDGGFVAAPVQLRFELPSNGPAAFGSLPWPNDLYLDEGGRISVGTLPNEERASQYLAQLRAGLAGLDGFGATTPVYFYFDGAIDPDTLPDADAVVRDDAPAFLLDIDANSPTLYERVAVDLHYHPASRRLALRPRRGSALSPGRRYVAVVTDGLEDAEGEPVGPSPDFTRVRAVGMPDATDAARRAWESYSPVFDAVERAGVPRERVIGLSPFRVQSVAATLREALTIATAATPEFTLDAPRTELDGLLGTPRRPLAGLDVPGGVLHSGLGALVQGRLMSPNFASAAAGEYGSFQRDAAGQLRVKRMEAVPFSLWLPPVESIVAPLSLVVFQHDEGGDRSQSVVLANRLASLGVAVVALDLPYHGGRGTVPDTRNAFTGEELPDGFGDARGDFVGLQAGQSASGALNPGYYRGAVFQSLVDLAGLLLVMRDDGLPQALAGTAYADISFARQRIGFVGIGLGGELGIALAAQDLGLGLTAVEAVFSGAHVTDTWSGAPGWRDRFDALADALGVEQVGRDAVDDPPEWWPAIALYQTLIDAADPVVLAAGLRRVPMNVLLASAEFDEYRTPLSVEGLAAAVGAELLGHPPVALPTLGFVEGGTMVSGNYLAGNDPVTRVLVSARNATAAGYLQREGVQRYAAGGNTPLPTPVSVQEPLDAMLSQTAAFLMTQWACELPEALCPASVSELP